ncbi:N-terminal double-transmembrane domain-containing protein [Robiginitalea myxolifaciens]|uniref:N-terminal double-transmembrane domain-containing protein n=1 Tax=Robiginitalea myxolifaciens TaxID=400055 RepID=A0A1I6HK85_9FLAO|nr:BatA domain-containing protein [Robiginitalea myxolifaciens]SFR54737.1 N-terminal double-transmembrane domain-containing protein [Robiginitalea myxolifaciens]
MSFANPTLLWTLLGVLVPISIHLWSRREARTLKVGSVSLLEASSTVKSRALRPSEWLLLFLRCLVIALLALLMANPFFEKKGETVATVYVLDPALLIDGYPQGLLDSLPEDAEVRLLQSELPVLDVSDDDVVVFTEDKDQVKAPGYWQLIPELTELKADSVVVYTRGYVSGLKGRRPAIPGRIRWKVLPEEGEKTIPLVALQGQNTQRRVSIQSSGKTTSWVREEMGNEDYGDQLALVREEALAVQLDLPDSLENERRFLLASLKAGASFLQRELQLDSGPVLYFERDPLSKDLIRLDQAGNLRLTRRLNPQNTVEERLTEQLVALLVSDSLPAALARKYDRRQVASTVLGGPESHEQIESTAKASMGVTGHIRPWILGLLCAALIGERLIARIRKQ